MAAIPASPVPAGGNPPPPPSPEYFDPDPTLLRLDNNTNPLAHPVVGRIPVMTQPFRWSGIDRWIRFPAPTLGQHNHEVLSSILGLDEAEIEQLEDQGVIGTRPAGL